MESDKHYWHGYVDEYERLVFANLIDPKYIFEYGVLAGASIQWLSERFPSTTIIGGDICNEQLGWPHSNMIRYVKVDQGDRDEILSAFNSFHTSFDLIIDDGSHRTTDQAACLVHSLPWVRDGGYYILEDAHTSYPKWNPNINVFHILLCFQHLRNTNQQMTDEVMKQLTTNSLFSKENIVSLFNQIDTIHLYRRTRLPLRCYYCGEKNFDYTKLLCSCSVPLLGDDSMSFILKKF